MITNKIIRTSILSSILVLIFTFSFSANAFSQKKDKKASAKKTAVVVTPLTPEEQRKFDYFFLEAIRMKEKEDFAAAFELLNHALEIDPNSASALYEISRFYFFLKQSEKGMKVMEKAVEMDPDNFWYKHTLAAFYQSNGNFKRAIEVYEDMAAQFPDKHESLMMLIDLYNRHKNYPMVIKTLDRLEEKEGKSEQISMEKFRIYLTSGDDKNAFKEIESLAKEYPHDMRYLSILGDVYMNNGKEKEAYQTYKKVLSAEPDNTMAMLSLASYYEKTGQQELYQQQMDSILLNKKVDTETRLNIMRQLIVRSEQSDKDSTKIIGLFDTILREDSEDTQMPMLYAQYLISKEMEEESVPVLNRIIVQDPENTPARLQLLSYALKNADYEEVIRVSEPALIYTPEILEFYYYLSLAYYQDNKDKALEVLHKAMDQITPETNKEIVGAMYSMMGEIYHTKEMKKEAFTAYDSALVYNPEDIMTLNNYAYYLSVERQDLDRAEEMSYKTIKAEPKNATFLDTYAWILFEKGRYAEAKIHMDEAMKNGGEESDVVVEHAGDVYYMSGDKEKAMEYWKQAKEMGSESKTLQKKIDQKKYIAE